MVFGGGWISARLQMLGSRLLQLEHIAMLVLRVAYGLKLLLG